MAVRGKLDSRSEASQWQFRAKQQGIRGDRRQSMAIDVLDGEKRLDATSEPLATQPERRRDPSLHGSRRRVRLARVVVAMEPHAPRGASLVDLAVSTAEPLAGAAAGRSVPTRRLERWIAHRRALEAARLDRRLEGCEQWLAQQLPHLQPRQSHAIRRNTNGSEAISNCHTCSRG